MQHKRKFRKKRTMIASLLLAGIMAFSTACGSSGDTGSSESSSATAATEVDQEAIAEARLLLFKEDHNVGDDAITGKGFVNTFLADNLPTDTVKDEEAAQKAIMSVMDRLGGDSTIKLESDSVRPTETGVTYYIFNQFISDVRVYGAAVKLIADKDGKVIGISSSIVPGLEDKSKDEDAINEEAAIKVVEEKYAGQKLTVYKEATELTLLPEDQGSAIYYYAWVVYTNAVSNLYDTMYTAHYVSLSGKYINNAAVKTPGSEDARSGVNPTFDFESGTMNEIAVKVTHTNGKEEEITIPVIVQDDGTTILADPKRKIVCAEFAPFNNSGEVDTIKKGDNGFDNLVLLEYSNTIRIYDYFNEIGWTGADGEETPILILVNALDENGDPANNAYYVGKINGYQCFGFDGTIPYGDCVDVMAHEYTHCVTSQMMTMNLYENDAGAINEALSDIIGNLVEMGLGEPKEGYWLIAENLEKPLRNMADPNKISQPAYVGDRYHVPQVNVASDANDRGGVHTNSSLLNLISYKLDQAGMPPEDQVYFWLNVSLAITPRTDYPEMAKILPWCMKQNGYEKYLDALNKAIEETGISSTDIPTTIPDGCARASLDMDFSEYDENYDIVASFIPKGADIIEANGAIAGFEGQVDTWPSSKDGKISVALPEGSYALMVSFTPRKKNSDLTDVMLLYSDEGWTKTQVLLFMVKLKNDPDALAKNYKEFAAGKNVEISTNGLKELIEEK